MNRMIRQATLIAAALAAISPAATSQATRAKVDQVALNEMIARHQQMKATLPAEDQAQLDRLTAIVKRRLWAGLSSSNLMVAATQVVNETIPALTPSEAAAFAEYALGGIAAIGAAAGSSSSQTEPAQTRFNQQYVQLRPRMPSENGQYTAISNVMKTKHDTVKNSINNVR